jgi:hypothetical protein
MDGKLETERNWTSEISIDGHGGVCYHNPTSALHEAPENQRSNYGCSFSIPSPEAKNNEAAQQKDVIKQALVSNAATQRRFETLAVENMVQTDVSNAMASELLLLHWCWVNPMFMFIYRPAFTREDFSAK